MCPYLNIECLYILTYISTFLCSLKLKLIQYIFLIIALSSDISSIVNCVIDFWLPNLELFSILFRM